MEKPINLNCEPLLSFTLENTLILFMDSMNCPNMPMNAINFSHSNFPCSYNFQETAKYYNMKKIKSGPRNTSNRLKIAITQI